MTDWDELQRLAEQGDEQAALEALKTAWENTGYYSNESRRLHSLLGIACRRLPSVRAHFTSARNASTPEFEARRNVPAWLALNRALDDDQYTLDWFDQARAAGRKPTRWSMLEQVVIRRGDPADFLWLHGGPVHALREAVMLYLCLLAPHRGFVDASLPEMPFEQVLSLFPLEDRRARTDGEREIELEQTKEIGLVIAAFEAVNPDDHSLRKLADELLDSPVLREGLFTWEERSTLGPPRTRRHGL